MPGTGETMATRTAADRNAADDTGMKMSSALNAANTTGAVSETEPRCVQCKMNTAVEADACWGCPKVATNACECFGTVDWSGDGPTRPTPTAKNRGIDGGTPSNATQAHRRYSGPTSECGGVLGVPQSGHKRL